MHYYICNLKICCVFSESYVIAIHFVAFSSITSTRRHTVDTDTKRNQNLFDDENMRVYLQIAAQMFNVFLFSVQNSYKSKSK